ncbi:MAG: META domain-containing protein [Nevskiales bacterium]
MTRFMAVIFALSLAACARGVEPPPPAAPVALEGSTFRLVNYRGEAVPGDGKYLLSFDAKSLQANFCNRMFGAYRLQEGRISAQLAATKMYCVAPQLMEMEQGFAQLLEQGAGLERESHSLRLLDQRGVAVFVYQVYMD